VKVTRKKNPHDKASATQLAKKPSAPIGGNNNAADSRWSSMWNGKNRLNMVPLLRTIKGTIANFRNVIRGVDPRHVRREDSGTKREDWLLGQRVTKDRDRSEKRTWGERGRDRWTALKQSNQWGTEWLREDQVEEKLTSSDEINGIN